MKIFQLIIVHFFGFRFALLVSLAAGYCSLAGAQTAESVAHAGFSQKDLNDVIIQAFKSTHQGYSSDEVILQDDLNRKFVSKCLEQIPTASPATLNWTLLNLRKAGKLGEIATTRRVPSDTSMVTHIAEIVARSIQDKHAVTTDRIMTDPQLRHQFDQQAGQLDPNVDLYLVRKAAFQLRKTRRLKPELITRVADWQREISEFSVEKIRQDLEVIPDGPGVYIFRDSTGYLYIGQSQNLRERLKSHLDQADNLALAKYLAESGGTNLSIEIHSFPKDSRAMETMVRRAYESELIRSRKPRFNILP